MRTGDFGRPLRTQEPVADMLGTRVPVTLQLTVMSILLSHVIGVPAGVAAPLKRNSWSMSASRSRSWRGAAILGRAPLIMLFLPHAPWLSLVYVPITVDPDQNIS
jgi:peptide/nickel transport system permease protein